MIYLAGFIAAIILLIIAVKPRDRSGGYDDYYGQINKSIKENTEGTPIIFCDLDRLDRNISRMIEVMGKPDRLRIVTKSLPSVKLLQYIMGKTGTKKLMCFHGPFLPRILQEMNHEIDILMGKPLPVKVAESILAESPEKEKDVQAIQWLIDTVEKLSQYCELAKKCKLRLKVNIEIDIGLKRGGVDRIEELDSLLSCIKENTGHLAFSGFMGYEGHVPHAPPLLKSHKKAVKQALQKTMDRYNSFYSYAETNFPEIFTEAETFNSGGSGTFRFFTEEYPINDIAVGGAFVRPASYSSVSMNSFEPALFIAAPILKILGPISIPFLEFMTPLFSGWNPNMRQSFCIYGGGWSGDIISPPGISTVGFINDPPNQNMLPNQTLVHGSKNVSLSLGDNMFYWPFQSDAMFQFNNLYTIRKGKITGKWKTFPFGY